MQKVSVPVRSQALVSQTCLLLPALITKIHSSSCAQSPFFKSSLSFLCVSKLCAGAFFFTLSKTVQAGSPAAYPALHVSANTDPHVPLKLYNARSPLEKLCIMFTAAGNRYRLYRELCSTALQVNLFEMTIQNQNFNISGIFSWNIETSLQEGATNSWKCLSKADRPLQGH